MDDQKQQVTDRLKQATNVLVTVSNNPSVDQLAACIGLTLILNKMGKHATAVYSGSTPSVIEFLKPEQTIEKNTDSLRDFIIALDKSKADKLRYKVEDKVVRIFITPYHTSLSEKDLDFSLGDFNVDVVVALGVNQQADLDQAIVAHGRILHDATVISISTNANTNLGSINWQNTSVSSLSELVVQLANDWGNDNIFDAQIATSLLTGIVAATSRFSNSKTSAQTMTISAQMITAGANQQLVATKLEPPAAPKQPSAPPQQPRPPQPPSGPQALLETAIPIKSSDSGGSDDGSLVIDHSQDARQIDIDAEGTLHNIDEKAARNKPAPGQPSAPSGSSSNVTGGSSVILQPPSLGGTLTANTNPEGLEPGTDPLSLPPVSSPLLEHESKADQFVPAANPAPALPSIDSVRGAVDSAVAGNPSQPLPPIAALNAQPIFENSNPFSSGQATGVPPLSSNKGEPKPAIESRHALDMPPPPTTQPNRQSTSGYGYGDDDDVPSAAAAPRPSETDDTSTPPPVPPPMTPPVF